MDTNGPRRDVGRVTARDEARAINRAARVSVAKGQRATPTAGRTGRRGLLSAACGDEQRAKADQAALIDTSPVEGAGRRCDSGVGYRLAKP